MRSSNRCTNPANGATPTMPKGNSGVAVIGSMLSPARPSGKNSCEPDERALRMSPDASRSEEHTSELQSQSNLVCRLLLEKKKTSIELRIREHHHALIPRICCIGCRDDC